MPVPKGYTLDAPTFTPPAGYTLDGQQPTPPAPQLAPAPAGNTIGAAPEPSFFENVRNTVANSAIGHALESTLPKVADALSLRPTESVNSPTYQADKGQILAPQYLAPSNPQSAAGKIWKGALRGVGNMTSGKNLATAAGVASGFAGIAPLVPAIAAQGAGIGMTALGAMGTFDDLKAAKDKYSAGQTDEALDDAGAALPNAALLLPSLGHPIEAVGKAAQNVGVDVMDSYLKAGKKAFRYGAEPGRGVLQEGPGTSIGLTRQRFADQVTAAKGDAGQAIQPLVNSSTATIPRSDLAAAVAAPIDAKRAVLSGPGGNLAGIKRLDDLQQTFAPLTSPSAPATVPEVYAAKRNMDQNINWGRDVDPLDATVNNANREIRSGLAGQLYGAAPELQAASQRYSNLATASKLATDRTFDTNGNLFSPFKMLTGTAAGVGTASATHNPGYGVAAGLFSGLLPEVSKAPIVKTGGATALFQGGRAAAAVGRGLQTLSPFSSIRPLQEAGAENYNNGSNSQAPQNPTQHVPTPGSGLYSMAGLTPEIIRPEDMSRSKIGVGANGRGGVLIRPLGALPAPAAPEPTATPYVFNPKPPTAFSGRSPASLYSEVGSASNLVPQRLLSPVVSPGSPEEQAAALRQASVGSMAHIAPLRSFAGDQPLDPAMDVRTDPDRPNGLSGRLAHIAKLKTGGRH